MVVDLLNEEEFNLKLKESKVINKNWKELIKPKIEFVKDNDNFTSAELVAEPLREVTVKHLEICLEEFFYLQLEGQQSHLLK